MTEQVESTNCNIDSTQHYKRCIKKELDGNGKLHQKEYKINDDGDFVELIKDIPITDSIRLSNSNAATIYEANMKLNENEL